MDVDAVMEVDVAMGSTFSHPQALVEDQQDLSIQTPPPTAPMPSRDNFRDIQVKVHIRRPERDSWVYMGRGVVTQEMTGQSSRVGGLPPLAPL
ncbi:hypothetical protein DXG03_002770 [Asterophora parasitica]|uniref:Uncharacterized protein n=1 Tax=Asterophora parasitica TaxID=117018 RepID=A0A9P7G828_9AGAR|nr:hypothetical protein DXG03_002770 [Asterophora parasitica]